MGKKWQAFSSAFSGSSNHSSSSDLREGRQQKLSGARSHRGRSPSPDPMVSSHIVSQQPMPSPFIPPVASPQPSFTPSLSSHSSFYAKGEGRVSPFSSPTPSTPPTFTDGGSTTEVRYAELYEEEEAPFSNLSLENKLKIVIVGSGFAGLSAAIACRRQGYQVTLVEKSVGISVHGDNISLGCNATKILSRWGLLKDLWNHALKGGYWVIKDEEGQVQRVEDLRDFPALYAAPLIQGHRAQLLGVLGVTARLLGVRFRLQTEVVSYQDSPKQPSLTTAEGEVIFADCIVIADGIKSKGRDLLARQISAADRTPNASVERKVKASGYVIHRSLVKSDKIRSNPKTSYLIDGNVRVWLGHDSHLLFAPIDNGRQCSFSFVHYDTSGSESLNWRDRKPISQVTDVINDWDPTLVEAIKTFKTTLKWQKFESRSASQWTTAGGHIVFIGDAVHPLPPSSFQGGSQSVEDGAALALTLALAGGRPEDVPRALEVFQEIRKPRVDRCSDIGVQQRTLWHGYASILQPSCLDLLISDAYTQDEELHVLAEFERITQQVFDPSWSLPRERRAAVLKSLEIGKHTVPLSGLYMRAKKPTI